MWRSVSVVCAAIAGIALAGQAGLSAEHSRVESAKTLAILVDTSQAMQPHVQDVRTALGRFVREMQPTHEIAIIEFGERPTVLTDYTSDPVRLQRGVERVFSRSGSGAYTLDAIVETSKGLRNREGTHPDIVVITAEGPEFSNRFHEAVLDELKTTGATLHALVLTSRNQAFRATGAREREIALALGAEQTGGTREHLLSSLALEPRLHELATRLK
jgi:hypothetical protein